MARPKSNLKCKFWWCDRKYYAGGMCLVHYRRSQRHDGDPLSPDEHKLLDALKKSGNTLPTHRKPPTDIGAIP